MECYWGIPWAENWLGGQRICIGDRLSQRLLFALQRYLRKDI
ncbi:hypothetical protein [Microbulbifer halophilus]